MDLLNMTNRAQIHEFYNKVKRGFFYRSGQSLKFCDLLGGWKLAINAKFQLNISKITPARPETQGLNTAITTQ